VTSAVAAIYFQNLLGKAPDIDNTQPIKAIYELKSLHSEIPLFYEQAEQSNQIYKAWESLWTCLMTFQLRFGKSRNFKRSCLIAAMGNTCKTR